MATPLLNFTWSIYSAPSTTSNLAPPRAGDYTTPRWSRLMRGGGCGCVVILSSGLEPEEDGMAAAVPLRPDFDTEALRALAKGSRDLAQTRRLLALSVIYAG